VEEGRDAVFRRPSLSWCVRVSVQPEGLPACATLLPISSIRASGTDWRTLARPQADAPRWMYALG
jgi:hypothetical protein